MREIVLELGLFGLRDRALSELAMQHVLDCVVRIDCDYLRRYPHTPRIYDAGVRWIEDPPGIEVWRSIPEIMRAGGDDCDGLSAWCAAERIVYDGRDARCVYRYRPVHTAHGDVVDLYHIAVEYDGRIEDPSAHLGMPRTEAA